MAEILLSTLCAAICRLANCRDTALIIISAYATDARLVLVQEKVSETSNEITAMPKLLDCLALEA